MIVVRAPMVLLRQSLALVLKLVSMVAPLTTLPKVIIAWQMIQIRNIQQ